MSCDPKCSKSKRAQKLENDGGLKSEGKEKKDRPFLAGVVFPSIFLLFYIEIKYSYYVKGE